MAAGISSGSTALLYFFPAVCQVLFLLLLLGTDHTYSRLVSLNTNRTNSHLVVHKHTGDVYVGATNRIFQLRPHALEVVGVQKVGPFEDSPACFGYRDRVCPKNGNVTLTLTDNHNKILVIDYERENLVHCGSVFQGICWIVGLENVSDSEIDIVDRPVVANDELSSSVGFIGPGPPDPANSKVLYVATSFTGNSNFRHNVPSVSSRTLDIENILDFASGTGLDGAPKTRIFIANRVGFPVRYVYGFSSGGFSYFLSVQKRTSSLSATYGTKLIRVCQNDGNFSSYTEIPMECKSSANARRFPLVQAGFLGRAGQRLARDLEDSELDEVLYATFSTAEPYGSVEAGGDSALCVFSMRDVRRMFTENIRNCFKGQGRRGLDFIKKDVACVQADVDITDDFCGSSINSPRGGEVPIVSRSVATFAMETATAVAVSVVGDTTVAFVGTSRGEIRKMTIDGVDAATEYDSIPLEPGTPILADLVFDSKETHLYALTRNKVFKLPVHGKCMRHFMCKDCTEDGDPYCGWCVARNRCASLTACLGALIDINEEGTPEWLSYREADKCAATAPFTCSELATDCSSCVALDPGLKCGWCAGRNKCQRRSESCGRNELWLDAGSSYNCTAPHIIAFHPRSGPKEGGTDVTILLSSMKHGTIDFLAISVAGVQCTPNGRLPYSYGGEIQCRVRTVSNLLSEEKSGPVVVRTPDFRIESEEPFRLVMWRVEKIAPPVGPLRGGTKLRIFGENLDAGSRAVVFVGELRCSITKRENDSIECITGSFHERGTFGIKVSLDDHIQQLPPIFSYIENPILMRTKNPVIQGTLRGGGHVLVEGRHLDGVQTAFFVITLNETEYRGACNVTTEDNLYCLTPKMDADLELLKQESESHGENNEYDAEILVLPYKFELDGVDTFLSNFPPEKHQYFLRLSDIPPHRHHDHDHADAEGSYTFAIAVTVLLVLLVVGIVGYCFWRRRQRSAWRRRPASRQYKLTATELDEFQKGKPKDLEKGALLPTENPYVVPYNQKFEIPERRFILDLDAILGSGNFGVVTKGAVDGIPTAVKTVKPDAEKMHLMSLMSELKILVYLGNSGKHLNIVNLVGAHTKNMHKGSLYVFVEYCPLGSLDKYLREHRACFCNQLDGDLIDLTATADRYENLDPSNILCTLDLINFSHQIAKGMEYLAEKKVIHADLATRNLLLYDKMTVKITDFGLARKLYDYTNYVKKHQEPLPWRWMAIESLRDLSFSHQSDVWAYGITLWEIFTLGDMPYPGLSWAIDFTHRLQQGLLNLKPKYATSDIYNTMLECWRLRPEDRPEFSDIRKFFNSMLVELSSQVAYRFHPGEQDPEGYLVPLLTEENRK